MDSTNRPRCRACGQRRKPAGHGLCRICNKKIAAADRRAELGAIQDVRYWERHAQD